MSPFPTRLAACLACVAVCGVLPATEPRPLPPELLESFTRSIQPLLLNRCAAGGCHGGRKGHEPLLLRHNAAGQIDRDLTLANLDAFRRGATTPEQARERTAALAVAHPEGSRTAPLSTAQMNALRTWLVAAAEADARPVHQAAAAAAPPNRFRTMLDAARDPTPLWPPPQEPKGVIFKKDDGEAAGDE
jgi:hypothetical protein